MISHNHHPAKIVHCTRYDEGVLSNQITIIPPRLFIVPGTMEKCKASQTHSLHVALILSNNHHPAKAVHRTRYDEGVLSNQRTIILPRLFIVPGTMEKCKASQTHSLHVALILSNNHHPAKAVHRTRYDEGVLSNPRTIILPWLFIVPGTMEKCKASQTHSLHVALILS